MPKDKDESGVADVEITITVKGKNTNTVSMTEEGVDLRVVALWQSTILGAFAALSRKQALGEDPFSALD